MSTKDVLVIGLGRFGGSIVTTLIDRGQRVTVVDNDEAMVNRYASLTEFAKVADTRNEQVLKQLGVNNFDHVVVAIGHNIEASIITVLLLKDMGVENLTVKAATFLHRAALLKLGVDAKDIVMPEQETGKKIAHSISFPLVADFIPLIGSEYGLIELYPGKSRLTNHTLEEINLKYDYNVMVVAIRRGSSIIMPNKETVVKEEDSLIIVGRVESLENFEASL